MNLNEHLDNIIRDALVNLEADYDPNTWDMLEEQLDALPAGDELLDRVVAGSLASMEIPLRGVDWNLFEQRLEAEEAAEFIENEVELDSLAYERLHQFETPLSADHWNMMAQRLEEEYSIRHTLVRYKAAEIALVFLLVLTFFKFAPFAESIIAKISQDSNQVSRIEATVNDNALSFFELNKPGIALNPSLQRGSFYSENESEAVAVNSSSIVNREINVRAQNNDASRIAKGGYHVSSLLPFDIRSFINSHPAKFASDRSSIPSISSPLNARLPFLVTSNSESVRLASSIIPVKKPMKVKVSLFTVGDYSYVFSPSESINLLDTLIATGLDTTGAIGYGGGILINLKKGKFEFQTGGIYSFKRYVPNTPIFLFETVRHYVEEDFRGIQQDMLQVPMNLLYHLKDEGNWRIYALGGASFNFITSSVYEIRYTRTPAFNINVPGVPGEVDKSVLAGKEFPKGLADGGSLKDNLYITANLGFGVERYVTPNWSLFVQPNYHHYLNAKGIGTNKDKFYTLSLQLGTKVSIR